MAQNLMTIEEAGRALGVSRATVWRRIQRGQLASIRRGGRRLVSADAPLRRPSRGAGVPASVPAFTPDHAIFRLVGAGRGGGQAPGARDKHGILDR